MQTTALTALTLDAVPVSKTAAVAFEAIALFDRVEKLAGLVATDALVRREHAVGPGFFVFFVEGVMEGRRGGGAGVAGDARVGVGGCGWYCVSRFS